VRERPHFDPDRRDDVIVEVVRDGKVAATIYGSREGLAIVSERFEPAGQNRPFFFWTPLTPKASYVIPLLDKDEKCPWCDSTRLVELGNGPRQCPVCAP
jgi:hypothetical protein